MKDEQERSTIKRVGLVKLEKKDKRVCTLHDGAKS